MHLFLDLAELEIVITALAACTPSGGGSPIHTLTRKLSALAKFTPTPEEVMFYQSTAAGELGYDEALVIEPRREPR